MIKRKRKKLIQIYFISDILAICATFFITYWFRFQSTLVPTPKGIPGFKKYLIVIPFLLLAHLIHFSYQGYYKIKLRRNRLDDLFLVVLNTIVTVLIILLIFSYFRSYRFIGFDISRLFLVIYIPIAIFLIFGSRLLIFSLFRRMVLRSNGISKVLIAGDGELARLTAEKLNKYKHFGIEVAGFLSPRKSRETLGSYKDLTKIVHKYGITDLFVALSLKEYETIMKMIEEGNNLLIDVKLVPDILQITSLKSGMEHLEGIPIINLGDIPLYGWGLFFKRSFDFLSSLFGIAVLSPLFLVVAALIKLTSKGPVFYSQTRVGMDGKIFRMIKFRTMVKDAEKETGAIWSPKNDKRVTKIGKWLRKYSVDEFPQLINVLKGDMSMVGPRPERPELVDEFKYHIPKYMLRHRVKTGMTGWAQVHGLRGNTPLDKRIEFDIYYIQNWTFRLDLEILWRTIFRLQFIDKN